MDEPSTSASSIIPEDSPVDEKDMPATSAAIAELFEGIDTIYFMEHGFKAISNELEKLAHVCSDSELEIDELERERFKLKRQMQVVSKKMYALIVKNSLDFNRQVENYEEVRIKADELLQITRTLRSSIDMGRRKCKLLAVILASSYKKRISMVLKRELAIIATLHSSECRIRELRQEGNTLVFLQFIVEAMRATQQYHKYAAVKQISRTLLQLLRAMESRIDELLAQQTKIFQLDLYILLNSAYQFLGNLELTSTKLQNYFRNSLDEISRTTLLVLLRTYQNLQEEHGDLSQLPFEKLCQFVEPKDVVRSLCELGSALLGILRNYHAMLKFHIDEDGRQLKRAEEQNEGGGEITDQNEQQQQQDIDDHFDTQLIVEKGIMQKSLLDNVFDIFSCAAESFNTLLANLQLTSLKFDQFLRVIDVSERFRKFGQLHFGNPCPAIELTLEAQSRSYFDRYHLEKMDELKMFVENEMFTLCPVSAQFGMFDLPEFFFLKELDDGSGNDDEKDEQQTPAASEILEISVDSPFTGKQISFSLLRQEGEEDDEIFPRRLSEQLIEESPKHRMEKQRLACRALTSSRNSSSCDTNEGGAALGQMAGEMPNSMPNLCNSALNVLRIIGRYIRMCTLLRSSAEHTIEAIIQLYNYYIYALFTFFCSDPDAQQQQQMFGIQFASLRLRQYIQAIVARFNANQSTPEVGNLVGERAATDGSPRHPSVVASSTLCHALDKNDRYKLFLLAERIVGIESGIFLAKQMELLRPFLESLLSGKGHSTILDSFYKTLPAVFDLGDAAFGCVAAKAISHQEILKQIQSVDWGDVREIHSQHSSYVDAIVKEFGEFRQKLAPLYAYVQISEQLHASIWSMLLLSTIRILVQGYAEAKKCSIEGRALQLLDIGQLCGELEELTGLRPLPHRAFAENYVKAFYLPVDELSQWIVHHTEYSLSQTSALLNAASASAGPGGGGGRKATMSRIMANLLDASGMGDGAGGSSSSSLFQ